MTILNLEWSSFPSRDRESSTLVCNYLRYQNHNVIEGCILNAYNLIYRHKPQVLYMSNIVGARLNYIVARYAHDIGISVFTSHAEGDFAEENIEEFVWGHNYDKIIFESRIFFWSKRNASLSVKYFKDLINKIYITGSPGHDKYIIEKKLEIINYNRVNVACFDFSFTDKSHSNHNLFSSDTISFFEKQMYLFDEILYKTIKSNPNISFFIKQHPSTIWGLKFSGVEKSSTLPNAYLVDKNYSILEFLKSAPICISYQSNTSLESWLLGCKSITLNPISTVWPPDIYRTPFHEAQFICNSFNELDYLLKNIQNEQLSDLKIHNQKRLIKNIIGYNDGLNHVRIGNYISNYSQSSNKIKFWKINYILAKNQILWALKIVLSFLKNKSYSLGKMLEWNELELIEFQSITFQKQLEFYKSIGFSRQSLNNIEGQIFESMDSEIRDSHDHFDFS